MKSQTSTMHMENYHLISMLKNKMNYSLCHKMKQPECYS